MSITADALRRIAALNLDADQLREVISIFADMQNNDEKAAAALEKKRAKDRERKPRKKSNDTDIFDAAQKHHESAEQVWIDESVSTAMSAGNSTEIPRKFHGNSTEIPADNKRNPHKENTSSLRSSEVKKDSGGSAGARTISDALDLADELGRMAGFEPVDCPPGWCGASQTIQKFFNVGCPADVIRTAIRAELKRLSGAPPPDRFGWFEKPIARAFANFQRSLPVVAVPKMEIINGGKENSGGRAWRDGHSRNYGSATDAASDLRRYFAQRAEEIEREEAGNDRRAIGASDGGIPPRSV